MSDNDGMGMEMGVGVNQIEFDHDCCQKYSPFGVPPDEPNMELIKKMHPTRKALREDRLPHIWCSGCGIGSVVNAFVAAVGDVGLDWKRVSVISGIGCTGRVSGYMNTDSFHTTHGRAIPFAIGLGMARPDMKLVIVSGDGDLAAIGGNHLIHAARRNADLTVICVNNFNYGMTGGQHGPTTQLTARTKTTPRGAVEYPFNLPLLLKACGASYVARWTALELVRLRHSIAEALQKPGFTFVEVIAPCPTNYGGRNSFRDAKAEMEYFQEKTVMWDGEPLEEIGLELRGEIVVGTFVDTERETFRERLLKYWPAWPPQPAPPQAPPQAGQAGPEVPAAASSASEELEQGEPAKRKKPVDRLEVRIAGAGGQGVMLAGRLLGTAAAVHEQRNAVTIPSYGPESRGGASKSDIVISDEPIEYPRASEPDVLVIAFQEAYDKYKQPRAAGCTLITEENLIKLDEKDEGQAWTIPALEWAKAMGEERVFNMIMMGFATAITKVVTPEAMRTAIRNLGKMTELNLAAFERGYEYGLAERAKQSQPRPKRGQ